MEDESAKSCSAMKGLLLYARSSKSDTIGRRGKSIKGGQESHVCQLWTLSWWNHKEKVAWLLMPQVSCL